GEHEVGNGIVDEVYLNKPYGSSKSYLALLLMKPTKDSALSEQVFENVLSSVSFVNAASQVPTATVEPGGAHLDLYTKTVAAVLDGATLSVDGKDYLKNINNFSLYSQAIYQSDDGFKYTTLETGWNENNVE